TFRDVIHDVVAQAGLHLQLLALQRRAVADAADLELALEALGDAGHQVGDQRARGAPHGERALGLRTRVDLDATALHLGGDVVVQHDLQGALRPLDLDGLALDGRRDARGDRYRLLADAGHKLRPSQNTVQRISPPTLASRAAWSAMTPFGVDRMATPSPL